MKSYYLPLLLICAGIWSMHAEAQNRIMNVTTGSSVKKIEVSTQTRITFSKDLSEMIISTGGAEQAQTFNVDDIINIVFTIDSTTDLAEQELNGLKISHSAGIVTVYGAEDIDCSVWNMSGALVNSVKGNRHVTIDLTGVPSGVYIIKANNQTLKFIKH